MKKTILILLLTIPFIGFGQTEYKVEDTKWSNDSTIKLLKSNNQPVNGIIIGQEKPEKEVHTHQSVMENGVRISCIGHYKNGKIHHKNQRNGESIYYYKNGQIQSEGTLKDGYNLGLSKYYNKKGTLIEEGNFIEGNQDGPWKFYNSKGLLISETNWKEGEELTTKWYNKNGSLYQEGKYKGLWKKIGVWRNYYYDEDEIGEFTEIEEGNYTEGKKDGVWKTYICYEDDVEDVSKWEVFTEEIFQNGKKVKN